MSTRRLTIGATLLALSAMIQHAQQSKPTPAMISVCDLVQNVHAYAGRVVQLRAEVFPGVEDSPSILATSACGTTGHLVGIVIPESRFQTHAYKRLQRMVKRGKESNATITGLVEEGPFRVGGTGILLEARIIVYSANVIEVQRPTHYPPA